ncbi:unnamed protein product [Ixodes persulcatus]
MDGWDLSKANNSHYLQKRKYSHSFNSLFTQTHCTIPTSIQVVTSRQDQNAFGSEMTMNWVTDTLCYKSQLRQLIRSGAQDANGGVQAGLQEKRIVTVQAL